MIFYYIFPLYFIIKMKPLIFYLLVSVSFSLQCILVNSTQNIRDKTSQVISVFLLCLSLVFLSAVFILWLFTPYRPRSKLPLIFLSLNFIISLISNVIFSILYHQAYSVPYIFPVLSLLYTVGSIGIALLFERPTMTEGLTQDADIRIYPISRPSETREAPDIKINIELETTTFALEEPSSCTICLEDFIKEQEVKVTPCKHFFHLQCAKQLLNNKITICPTCRGSLYNISNNRH